MHEFGGQDAVSGQIVDDFGHSEVGVVRQQASKCFAVCSLAQVLAFVRKLATEDSERVLKEETAREKHAGREKEGDVLDIRLDRGGDTWELDFDGDNAAIMKAGVMDLPNRRRSHRCIREVGEAISPLCP